MAEAARDCWPIPTTAPAEPGDASHSHGQTKEDLDVPAARLVANWPEIPEGCKAELGRLLAGP
jgi:hypothetical protein